MTADGPVLCVSGIDMKDGTPIYDIKPYLPIADCKVEATGGFSDERASYSLSVVLPEHLASLLTEKERANLTELLAEYLNYSDEDLERLRADAIRHMKETNGSFRF